jgi:1,4-dihydroxy-2-naphthoyl-CoA hydrolase
MVDPAAAPSEGTPGLRISSSSVLPLPPAKAAACVLDLLGHRHPQRGSSAGSTIGGSPRYVAPVDAPLKLPDSHFDQLVGTVWGDMEPERATASLEIADHHRQLVGVVHGGVYCTLAESVASRATAEQVRAEGNIALGVSNNASFLRPMTSGTIHVEATRRHGGRTTWVWDVEHRDDDGRVCALNRVTIAVRALPPDAGR